jgi:hypothetical protein
MQPSQLEPHKNYVALQHCIILYSSMAVGLFPRTKVSSKALKMNRKHKQAQEKKSGKYRRVEPDSREQLLLTAFIHLKLMPQHSF